MKIKKTNNIYFFLFGIIFFAIYSLTIKIAFMVIEQVASINSINTAFVYFGLIGLVLLISAIFSSIYSFKKESFKLLNIVALVVFFGILLLAEFWMQKSENLVINNFNLSRELRFKILEIKSYLSVIFKFSFFIIIFLRVYKK